MREGAGSSAARTPGTSSASTSTPPATASSPRCRSSRRCASRAARSPSSPPELVMFPAGADQRRGAARLRLESTRRSARRRPRPSAAQRQGARAAAALGHRAVLRVMVEGEPREAIESAARSIADAVKQAVRWLPPTSYGSGRRADACVGAPYSTGHPFQWRTRSRAKFGIATAWVFTAISYARFYPRSSVRRGTPDRPPWRAARASGFERDTSQLARPAGHLRESSSLAWGHRRRHGQRAVRGGFLDLGGIYGREAPGRSPASR